MMIRKAERKKAKLRLGISGASGSGKTWSALEIATGMGGKIGMIDTEAGRGELYANDFDYDVYRLEAPYTVDKYISAIKMFENAGYENLIIDSLSHAWMGDGGVLTVVDNGGGWFAAGGRKGSSQQNALIEAIISSKMHIITTLRAKTEYVMEKNDKGKNEPRKVGLAPIQKDGLEYEFTVFMSINQENIAHVTKDNTKMFNQEFIKPTKKMGKKLIDWLNTGTDIENHFNEVIFPQILNDINQCQDLNELRMKYSEHLTFYKNELVNNMEIFIAAKDKRKEELLSEESDFIPPVIPTGFKNSQALVQGVA